MVQNSVAAPWGGHSCPPLTLGGQECPPHQQAATGFAPNLNHAGSISERLTSMRIVWSARQVKRYRASGHSAILSRMTSRTLWLPTNWERRISGSFRAGSTRATPTTSRRGPISPTNRRSDSFEEAIVRSHRALGPVFAIPSPGGPASRQKRDQRQRSSRWEVQPGSDRRTNPG